MMKTLITGLFVTAVATLPVAARADWDNLKQRGSNLEQEGKDLKTRGDQLETRGKELEARGDKAEVEGKADYDKGKVVEDKTVKTYKKGRHYAKTTTTRVHKE